MHVTGTAERALRTGHPWLFEGAIEKQSFQGKPGDLAVIFDHKDRFLAIGLYDPDSPIRVKILQHGEPASINLLWFKQKLARAAEVRKDYDLQLTNAFRLVHGENDGLPGLIVDRYADNLVLKLYSVAWMPYLNDLINCLTGLFEVERIILRFSRQLNRYETDVSGLKEGQILLGAEPDAPVIIRENGLNFAVDLVHGHKTGFFLDQKENRVLVEKIIAANESFRSVLDVFSYTGAFSLYAARGGATSVLQVDASAEALAAARHNFDLNQSLPRVRRCRQLSRPGNAFQEMDRLIKEGALFDVVIVDPPSFAQREKEVRRALNAYAKLTCLALSLIRTGGLLVMSSCSSRVAADDFFSTVGAAASRCGRHLQVLETTGHPLDHPVGFSEGAYLKCLFALAD